MVVYGAEKVSNNSAHEYDQLSLSSIIMLVELQVIDDGYELG